MFIDFFSRFARHRGGTVSIIAALALPLLLGFVALVGEFGYGLVVKVENQRTADMASFAAALAYSSTNSTTTMTAVAQNVAVLNGVAAPGFSIASDDPQTAAQFAARHSIPRRLCAPRRGVPGSASDSIRYGSATL